MSSSTALGSWPGTDTADLREAVRTVRDLLTDDGLTGEPGLPYLPEVPGRGPGADMIGRTAGMLVDLPVDLQPSGWRLVDRPGRDSARARAWLRGDLDELAEAFEGYVGPLKIQVVGPWTLAASVRLGRGERVLVDPGATRDLRQSLSAGVAQHLADLRRLVPGARPVVQLDEPGLPAALRGELPTSSGLGRLRAIDHDELRRALGATVVAARAAGAEQVALHCCAPDVPVALLRETGADALALDTTLLGPRGWESVAVAVEAGTRLWAGTVPTGGSQRGRGAAAQSEESSDHALAAPRPQDAAAPVLRAWHELGLDRSLLDTVTVTPACGLAGLEPAAATAVHRILPRAATELTEFAHS